MTLDNALSYIHKTKWLGSKPGLARTQKLLSLMGNPHKKLKFVHVAGTNGKGSVCACLSAILTKAGYKTGLYTSPYINVFNERMQVNGNMISDNMLCTLTEYIKPFADSMKDDPPTEFELITALAMEYFAREACDIVVLEVGMGGELDSTNVISSPEAAVIMAIDLDHTAFLGNTLEQVASAKSGIIKNNTDVIMYDAQPEVEKVFLDKCNAVNARLHKADFSKLCAIQTSLDYVRFDYDTFKSIKLGLVGLYQPKNACVAIKTSLVLRQKGYNISDKNIHEALREVKWLGRFEILGKNPIFILDGAHNPHGMNATAESLKKHFGDKKIHFLVGALSDKDVKSMMSMLVPLAEDFVTVRPENDRAMSSQDLKELVVQLGGKAQSCNSVKEGVELVLKKAGQDGICACLGSLYFSGEIRQAYMELKVNAYE
ncbi:MAG: bifunctional folylpolyglutamate synthase/dihydrofolate synthase [Clostridia bacterium]|nr:bifunctional folylpolyglutamate synthase/dihydrofolate synthase [Clostridia bacterium]